MDLCLHSGGILVQEPVTSQLGVTRATLGNLLVALEGANLVSRCLPMDLGGQKALKPRTRVYLADSGIRGAALLEGEEPMLDPVAAGLIVETAAYQHVRAFHYPERLSFGYWRAGDDREVGVVVHRPADRTAAIEVKYREDLSGPEPRVGRAWPRRRRFLRASWLQKHPAQFGRLGQDGPFQVLDCLFLYFVGHTERRWVDEPRLRRLA